MTLSDSICRWSARIEYTTGTMVAKLLLRYVGSRSRIHYSVRYWLPSKIVIGEGCEIRQGSFLDARSKREVSISLGQGVRIKDGCGFSAYGGEIQIGDNVLVGRCSSIYGHGGVFIGNNTMLSPYTLIISSNHLAYLDGRPFQSQGFTRESITIGDNVWVGAHVCILAGSVIASNTVIAAGAIVHGKLETGWLYGGVPAKPIKRLACSKSDEIIVHTRDWSLL